MDIKKINEELKDKSPEEIVFWAIHFAKKPVVTTNFRPYEAAILHVVSKVMPEINVIWCDTGYNTPQTYKHAEKIIQQLKLNIDLYVPKHTAAYRDAIMGVPDIDSVLHETFTRQVKLEPFQRAMNHHKPDVWFTNLRKGQTALRDSLDVVSEGVDGVLKVSPFYHWSDGELDIYMEEHQLENEFKYFDPTKVHANRECGLHITTTKN